MVEDAQGSKVPIQDLPLAVLEKMHPVLAEIAIAFSSINVVANSGRLRKVNIQPDYQVSRSA